MGEAPDDREWIENCHITVTQSMDIEGVMHYIVKTRGDVPLSTKVGLLEMAKMTLIQDFDPR